MALEGDGELPTSFYILTIMMVATVFGIPLLYRRIWVIIFGFIADIKKDINLPPAPTACRQYGHLAIRNLSIEKFKESEHTSIPRHADFPSNENGELETCLTSEETKDSKLMGRIEALYIHPIKSTHAIEVDTAQVVPAGFAYDRLFSFAQRTTSIPDPTTGNVSDLWVFLTQRSHPRLQMVKSEIWLPDPDSPDYDEDSEWAKQGGCLIVRFPYLNDMDISRDGLRTTIGLLICKFRARSWSAQPQVEFRIPIIPTADRAKEKEYTIEKMKIWREAPESWNVGSEVGDETLDKLAFFLGVSNPFTIFRIRPGFEREVYKNAPGADKIGYQSIVGFQDGVSLLLFPSSAP